MDGKLQQLFQVLRWCGAAMIVAASGTFLIQGWDEVGDVNRYLTLLGMTAILPGVAYVCGIRLREGRSARVLVLTFLALVPVHAAILAGFLLSQFGELGPSVALAAQWVAPSRVAALLLAAGAGLVLMPLTWAAFRVLSRPHARLLTACSAAAHGLLLVPERGVVAATLTMLPPLALASYCALRLKPETLEARLAVSSLAAPALVIAARQLLFYDVSSAFWGTLLSSGALALFAIGNETRDASIERTASVPLLLGVCAFLEPLSRNTSSLSTVWLSYGLIAAAALLLFAWQSTASKGFFLRTAVLLNAATATTTLLVDPRPWAALQSIAVGLALLSYGFMKGRRAVLYAGAGLASFGFVLELVHAIDVFEPSGWLALAGFGVALLALTAWLERRARLLRSSPANAKLSQTGQAIMPR